MDALKEVKHHVQQELCTTRAAYRQGRKLTAVKVYTINNESQHLYVYGVPKINLRSEVKSLFMKYGQVLKLHVVTDVETELFTECYHVQFDRIQAARIAKRLVDNKNFYGGVLHICYGPEQETMQETRRKLLQRNTDVLTRLCDASGLNRSKELQNNPQVNRSRKRPAVPLSEERLAGLDQHLIWKNVPNELDPRHAPANNNRHVTKHFQMPAKKGIEYGPNIYHNTKKISEKHEQKHSLIPTQVIKQTQKSVKRIVFRNKSVT